MAIDDNTVYGLTGAQVKELPEKIEAVKGLAKVLTADDYNWPTSNPDGVALWLLEPGYYVANNPTKTYLYGGSSGDVPTTQSAYIISQRDNEAYVYSLTTGSLDEPIRRFVTRLSNNIHQAAIDVTILSDKAVLNSLTSTSIVSPLSANQGKVLNDKIGGDLSNLYTTDKTSLINAINELVGQGGAIYQAGNAITINPEDNSINAEIYPADYFTADATATGEGSDITLDGTAELQLENIELKGDTEQATYSGKNLFDKNTATGFYGYFEGDNTTTSIITSGAGRNYVFYVPCLPNSTYTFSTNTSGDDINQFQFGTSSGVPANGVSVVGLGIASVNVANAGKTITTGNDANYLLIRIQSTPTADGQTVYNEVKEGIQIELSASKTDYEPYVGGIPSPNPDYPQEVQTVTGRQVVEITGKNLVNIPSSLTVNGTERFQTFSANLKEGQTIVVQVDSFETTGTRPNHSIYFFDKNTQSVGVANLSSTNKTTSVQLTGDCTSVYVYSSDGYANSGGVTTTYTNLMISKTGGDYVPYQGRQEYEVNLGKNLCTGVSQGYYVTSAANVVGMTGPTVDSGIIIPVQPYTDYTISTTTSQPRYRACFVDEEYSGTTLTGYNGVNADDTSNTVTINSGGHKFLVLNISNLTTAQIERGSTASPFASYFEPIELCKIGDYQDYIYRNNGEWYIHKDFGKVDLGSLTWTLESGNYKRCRTIPNIKYVSSTAEVGNALATNYVVRQGQGLSDHPSQMAVDTGFVAVNVYYDTSVTPSGLFYYQLATPTDTKITNETLASQLEALWRANSYDDQTILTATSANLPAILSVEAIKKSLKGTLKAINDLKQKKADSIEVPEEFTSTEWNTLWA